MDKTALKKGLFAKGLFAFILAAVVALLLAGCSGGASEKKAEEPKEVTYESIFEDYTAQLKEQAPVLVDEYKAEAKEKAGDIAALAELSNAKIAKLAETCDAGIGKMAELMQKNGDEYSTYEEWSLKLMDVYTDQAQLITDAYMASAM